MRRSPPSFRLFAAATVPSSSVTAAASFVSMRPTCREGRGNQWRTGVSSMPSTTTIMEQRFLLQQQPGNAKQGWFRPQPQSRHLYNCNYNHSRPPPPPPPPPPSSSYPRHNNIPDHPNPNYQNDKFRSRPSDYRIWEYATALHSPSERFMILSYNLLADYLAINHRTKLYFHIPPKFLDWEWRKGSLLFELGLWSPDIMCFQEVDRFQDLEEELKLRGYCGIWKMRTGNAIDGCAIFWRASRFRLLYEEWFEFNKLGLRDNVAQICVLELVGDKNTAKTSILPQCLTASNKVVICNIHVLYNPRRGEMKLGQVRVLLNRAHAVSKIWNGAPVVLCGDFNCTPKSPLYNYIAEQKLDLTEVDRDKVSGQASAEIRSPRSYSQNPRIQSIDKSSQATTMADNREIGMKQGAHYLNMQEQNYSDSIVGDISFQNAISQFASGKAGPDVSNDSFIDGHFGDERMTLCAKVTTKTESDTTNAGVDQTDPTDHVTVDKLKESQSELKNDGGFPVGAMTNGSDDNTAPAHPCFQTVVFPPNDNKIWDEAAISSVGYEDTTEVRNISNSDSSSELFHESDERVNELASCQFSPAVANVDFTFKKQLENSDSTKADENSVLDYFPKMDSVPDDVERTAYDPSKWTPMDLETATGNADCPIVEHPLKLKSTYTETEDRSGARDSNREPLVTSYNRRFSGTVDYICVSGLTINAWKSALYAAGIDRSTLVEVMCRVWLAIRD